MKPARTISWTLLLVTLATAGACASGGGRSAEDRGCELRTSDSAFARGGPVYRACGVEREAQLVAQAPRPAMGSANPRECFLVQLEFVVGTDGVPEIETVRTVKASSSAFANAVIVTLPRWKYEPALLAGVPVRQIVTTEQKMTGVIAGATSVGPGRGTPEPTLRPQC